MLYGLGVAWRTRKVGTLATVGEVADPCFPFLARHVAQTLGADLGIEDLGHPPTPQRVVITPRDDALAIGAERRARYGTSSQIDDALRLMKEIRGCQQPAIRFAARLVTVRSACHEHAF